MDFGIAVAVAVVFAPQIIMKTRFRLPLNSISIAIPIAIPVPIPT
jgi:hypothetical protein